MAQYEKFNQIRDEVYRVRFEYDDKIRDMILAQVDRINDLCDDFITSEFGLAKTFVKGMIYGALAIFDSEVVPMLKNIEFWINPDELVAELETFRNMKKEAES